MAILLLQVEAPGNGSTSNYLEFDFVKTAGNLYIHAQQAAYELLDGATEVHLTYTDEDGDRCTLNEQTANDALTFASPPDADGIRKLTIEVRAAQQASQVSAMSHCMSGEVIHQAGPGKIEVAEEKQAPSAPREEALIHDLEQQLAQTRQEAADLRQQLKQDSSTALEYAIKAENASKEAANAKCHLQELQDSIQRETHELKQLAQHLKEEVQGHRNEADKAKFDAEEAKSQLQQLRENTQRETVVMQHLVQHLRGEVAQAKSDAEKAKSDAEKAKSDAEKAKSDAEHAQSTAEEAKSDVEKAKLDAEKLQEDIRAACVPGLSACIHGCSPLIMGIEAQDDAKAYGDATEEFTELIAEHKALEAYRIGRMHISEPSSTSSSVPVSAKVSVQNDGEVPWPHTTVLASIEGDSMNLPIMVIGALEVGQAKEIEMDLSVSPTQGADSMLRSQMKSVWTVTDAATGARFGPLLIFEATWNLD